jgi:hypothetical protein
MLSDFMVGTDRREIYETQGKRHEEKNTGSDGARVYVDVEKRQ